MAEGACASSDVRLLHCEAVRVCCFASVGVSTGSRSVETAPSVVVGDFPAGVGAVAGRDVPFLACKCSLIRLHFDFIK